MRGNPGIPPRLSEAMLIFMRAVDEGRDPWMALRRAGHNQSVSTANALRRRGLLLGVGGDYRITEAGRRAIIGA